MKQTTHVMIFTQIQNKINQIGLLFSILFIGLKPLFAQQSDSLIQSTTDRLKIPITTDPTYQLSYKRLIVPAVFISYGAASFAIPAFKNLNHSTQKEINENQPDHIKWDNYTQYFPTIMVYGLNAFGVEGKHEFWDRTIIYASAQIISSASVLVLKNLVHEKRPDGSNNLSFPSGHTATAFVAAQFMFREYKDRNFWLSISGYPFAIFTGTYRMLNNRHWLNDVVAGAGFGILSTELAYFLYPKVNHLLGRSGQKTASMIMPFYDQKAFGIGFVQKF